MAPLFAKSFFFFESREDKNRVEREMKGGGIGFGVGEREERGDYIYICGERERNEREGSNRLGFLMGERVWCGGRFDQVGKKDKWLVVTDRAGFGR